MKNQNQISPAQLVPMDLFVEDFGLTIDIAYTRPNNLLLQEAVYHKNARLWLHEDFARIVLLAAKICRKNHDLRLILYDGLRTCDAQAAMLKTQRAIENPQWFEEPRFLSLPGRGAHPRGMAIDAGLAYEDGFLVDMGSEFDSLSKHKDPRNNPSHRLSHHNEEIQKNRAALDNAMIKAGEILEKPVWLLSEEWWDFRFPAELYNQYAPLSDSDLPPQMQCVERETSHKNFDDDYFENIRQKLTGEINAIPL